MTNNATSPIPRWGVVALCSIAVAWAALLGGCASSVPAPVIDRAPQARPAPGGAAQAAGEAQPGFYIVKKGDTLYSIALNNGQDYKDVAAWNNIDNPSKLEVGQQLRVTPPEGAAVAIAKPIAGPAAVEVRPLSVPGAPAAAPPGGTNTSTFKREPKGGKQPYSEQAWAQAQKGQETAPKPSEAVAAVKSETKLETKPESKPTETTVGEDGIEWSWPAGGKVIAGFNGSSSKGIDLSGKPGDPVFAAASGKIILVSNALRGYGNLIVILHKSGMQSVYANNSKVLVKEQETVGRGQKIAEVGSTDSDQPKLHFEIRQRGTPVDPLKHLPPH